MNCLTMNFYHFNQSMVSLKSEQQNTIVEALGELFKKDTGSEIYGVLIDN